MHFPEKLMVALRDGRKLIGVLRSWDQFGMILFNIFPTAFTTEAELTFCSKLGSTVNRGKIIRTGFRP